MHKITSPRGYKQPDGVGVPQPRPKQRSIDERPWRLIHDSKTEGQAYHTRRPSSRDRSARKARREQARQDDRAAALNASQAKSKTRKPSYKKREMDRVRMRNLSRSTRVYPMFDPAVHTASPTEWQDHVSIDQDRVYGINLNEAMIIDGSMLDASMFDGVPGEIVIDKQIPSPEPVVQNYTETLRRDLKYFEVVTSFGETVQTSICASPFESIELREASENE